jgi:hypothetical protein
LRAAVSPAEIGAARDDAPVTSQCPAEDPGVGRNDQGRAADSPGPTGARSRHGDGAPTVRFDGDCGDPNQPTCAYAEDGHRDIRYAGRGDQIHRGG